MEQDILPVLIFYLRICYFDTSFNKFSKYLTMLAFATLLGLVMENVIKNVKCLIMNLIGEIVAIIPGFQMDIVTMNAILPWIILMVEIAVLKSL